MPETLTGLFKPDKLTGHFESGQITLVISVALSAFYINRIRRQN